MPCQREVALGVEYSPVQPYALSNADPLCLGGHSSVQQCDQIVPSRRNSIVGRDGACARHHCNVCCVADHLCRGRGAGACQKHVARAHHQVVCREARVDDCHLLGCAQAHPQMMSSFEISKSAYMTYI